MMAVLLAEQALAEAGYSRPGDGLRTPDVGQEELFDGEPSLVAAAIEGRPWLDYEPPKRGGRPSGAKGKATRELMATLDKLGYKDPLIGAAEIVSLDWQMLARVLDCTKLEAFDRWLRCAEFLSLYKHQKTPIAVSAEGAPLIPLLVALGFTPEGRAAIAGAAGLGRIEADEAPMNSTTYEHGAPQVAQIEGRTVASSA